MIKDAFYFPHDSNARRDPNIVKLRRQFGWAAVGMYWAVIELLREQSELSLVEKEAADYVADDLKITTEAAKDLLDSLISCELLKRTDDGRIISDSLCRRMDAVNAKSKFGRALAEFRWGKQDEDAPRNAGRNAGRNAKRREEKRREEKKREESEARPEDQKCVARYMQELRPDLDKQTIWKQANLYWDYQQQVEWKVGKTKQAVKDWQASVRTWITHAVDFGHISPKKTAPQSWVCPGCKKAFSTGERPMHLDTCDKLKSMPPDVEKTLAGLTDQMTIRPAKGERKR